MIISKSIAPRERKKERKKKLCCAEFAQ